MLYALLSENSTRNNPQPIIAELIGDETCSALGLTACGASPVLELCRLLLAAGYDPDAELETYRGNVLCLRVRSIGEAAALEVAPRLLGFRRIPGCREGSPVRKSAVRGHPCSAAMAGRL